MKPWHWILIALFILVIIFAIYAIQQAQKAPKVIVQAPADTKAGIWDVIGGLSGLFGKKDEDDKEPVEESDVYKETELGPPQPEYLNA